MNANEFLTMALTMSHKDTATCKYGSPCPCEVEEGKCKLDPDNWTKRCPLAATADAARAAGVVIEDPARWY
jgi:hypothetical protein